MQMRIVVPDATSLSTLAEGLMVAFGSERISVRGESREMGVRVEGESDRSVPHVVDAVDRWHDEAGVGSVEMWLGERSFTLARWAPVETWQ